MHIKKPAASLRRQALRIPKIKGQKGLHPPRPLITALSISLLSSPLPAAPANALGPGSGGLAGLFAEANSLFWLTLCLACLGLACFMTVLAVRQRASFARGKARLRLAAAEARRDAERAERLLHSSDQLTLAFTNLPQAPQKLDRAFFSQIKVFGALELERKEHEKPFSNDIGQLLDFPQWLESASAARLEQSLKTLCQTGAGFSFYGHALFDAPLEITGRMAGQTPVVRIKALKGAHLQIARLEEKVKHLDRVQDTLRRLFDTAAMPFWMRNPTGALIWVNRAYVKAVGAQGVEEAIEQNRDLLDREARGEIIKAHQEKAAVKTRIAATLAGKRRVLDVVDVAGSYYAAGIATDVTQSVEAQSDLNRLLDFHTRILDEVKTPIAVFSGNQRLQFYNPAYQALWGLESGFLDARPLEGEILDQLRGRRLLPEQPDFAAWREAFLQHYHALERCKDDWWHLPDGRTLRVIVTPHPEGGLTQIFENVTEELDLRSRLKRLLQIQGETLDHLYEGVAVFTSDGRLQLFNPAFGQIWGLSAEAIQTGLHIGQLVESRFSGKQSQVDEAWQKISAAITSLQERRSTQSGQMALPDGKIIDYALIPLPEGMSMLTFVDVTDSVQIKQALIDRNQALETADAIKSTFVQHVSYALRAPLTNIIGFAQLLAEPRIGKLNDKQDEYVQHILSSSSSLMAIINDVMDLATVEAGIMELDLSEVDIPGTVAAVAEALQDRLHENNISLVSDVPPQIGSFIGDVKRVRQVLFHVLSNAIRFSHAQSQVTLACRRENEEIVFTVRDSGPGIPGAYQETAFEPFESTASADGRRHVGLGLSIVQKFMELHQGKVFINSQEGQGTHVVCRFPAHPQPVPQAAE